MNKNKRIVWKTQSAETRIASVRYRCLLPALNLTQLGYESVIIQKNEVINYFDNVQAIIFVKTFSKHDYLLACKAHESGVPVILDLCDNIFVDRYANIQNFDQFVAMSKIAAVIVTTGDELQNIIKQHVECTAVIVIPDQVETAESVQKLQVHLKIWRKSRYIFMATSSQLHSYINSKQYDQPHKRIAGYARVSIAVAKQYWNKYSSYFKKEIETTQESDALYKRVVWFGNHGAAHSNFGMGSLLSIQRNLEDLNKKIRIELLVVSNNKEKFDSLIKPFSIKTRYKKWNVHTIFNDIADSDVCVLPSYNDEFSLSKSPNRALLALSLGVPVVATRFTALEELSSCIILDDWDGGLTTYLTKNDRVSDDISKAKKILEANFSGNAVAAKWASILLQLTHHRSI